MLTVLKSKSRPYGRLFAISSTTSNYIGFRQGVASIFLPFPPFADAYVGQVYVLQADIAIATATTITIRPENFWRFFTIVVISFCFYPWLTKAVPPDAKNDFFKIRMILGKITNSRFVLLQFSRPIVALFTKYR